MFTNNMLFQATSWRCGCSRSQASISSKMRTRHAGPSLTFRQAWNGSCSSLPLMTMLGKSNKWTYMFTHKIY